MGGTGSTSSDVRRYRARLVEGHLSLVEDVARRVRSNLMLPPTTGLDDDLVGYGREALVRASRRYDATRGVPFGPYARHRVRGAMLDGLGELGGVPRRLYRRLRFQRGACEVLAGWTADDVAELSSAGEIREALHTAYLLASDGAEQWPGGDLDVDGQAGLELLRSRLRQAVEGLPERERALVTGSFYEGGSGAEGGRRLGLSGSYAARLHRRALEMLRQRMGLSRTP